MSDLLEWQPIETAPTDEPVLGWCFGAYPLWCKAQIWEDKVLWFDYNNEYELSPTHWIPLPKPPKDDHSSAQE